MRFAACFSFVVAITTSVPAAAELEQCRFIPARPEREACYQRQEIARVAQQKANEAREAAQQQRKPVDPIELHDEQVARSLRSICRGC